MFEVAYADSAYRLEPMKKAWQYSQLYLDSAGQPVQFSQEPTPTELAGIAASAPTTPPSQVSDPVDPEGDEDPGEGWQMTTFELVSTNKQLVSGYPKLVPPHDPAATPPTRNPYPKNATAVGPDSNGKWTVMIHWELKIEWEYA